MDSLVFTGLENEEDEQIETESKDVEFELGQKGHIQRVGSNATTARRFLSVLYGIISSGSCLKSVASMAGIWQSSNCWSLASIVLTIPLLLLVLIGESVIVFF